MYDDKDYILNIYTEHSRVYNINYMTYFNSTYSLKGMLLI